MTEKILHIVGRLVVPVEEFESQQSLDTAQFFAGVPGLRWKIWLIDRERGEAGGTYLFADEKSFDDYVNGPIVAQLREYPLWTDMRLSSFDIMADPSAVTRAPVGDKLPDERTLTFNRMAEAAARAIPSIAPLDLSHRLAHE
nr:YdhR family protein [Promineifilum sp.]